MWIYNRRDPSLLSIRGGSQPKIYKDQVYFAFSDGYLVSLNYKTGQVSWEKQINSNKKFRDVDASPVLLEDRLYISGFDDTFFCIKASSGQLIWRHEAGGYSAPLIFENKIYFPTTNNELHILEKSSGKLLHKISSKKGYITEPKVYKGLLIYGESEGDLLIRDINSYEVVARFSPGHGISSSPVIKSFDDTFGNVFFISRSANLYVLNIGWRAKVEKWPWSTQ